MTQEWKQIKETNGKYEVSNDGKIRRTLTYDSSGNEHGGDLLKGFVGKLGYHRIELRINGKKTKFMVHRLVAKSFLPNEDLTKDQVNHKDGNKLNNHISNLEWVNRSENQSHARQTGLNSTRFTHEEVNRIRMDYVTTDLSFKQLAEKYNTGQSFIGVIVTLKACKYFSLPIDESEYLRLLELKRSSTTNRAAKNRILPTKLTEYQINSLLEDWNSGKFKTKKELSQKYGVTAQYVGQLISGTFKRTQRELI